MSRPRVLVGVLALLAWCAAMPGCAGFRGGWESVPYLGDSPPAFAEARTPYEAQQRSELSLPGLKLGVGLDNQLRTYDTQVYLFVLPLYVNPRNSYTRSAEPGTTRVTLRVSTSSPGYVLRPREARLTVAGRTVNGAAAREFGQWDEQGNRVTSGGTWGYRDVGEEFALAEPGRTFLLVIDFPVERPPPESRDIALDLAGALQAPGAAAVPLIRFWPVRWKEGYT